jgi:hypothetical protein
MMWEYNCTDIQGTCGDFHEGLCMAGMPGFPKLISRLKKCPFGTVEDVIWVKNGKRYQHDKYGRMI